jgi:hypothetical protein
VSKLPRENLKVLVVLVAFVDKVSSGHCGVPVRRAVQRLGSLAPKPSGALGVRLLRGLGLPRAAWA